MSPDGILLSTLKIGVVTSVAAQLIKINLAHAGENSGRYLGQNRYGKGEVGELVLIEGQQAVLLGRITEVNLPDRERTEISQDFAGTHAIDAIGLIRLLGSVHPHTLRVTAGVSSYPRLGDRVYSAPGSFISKIPTLISSGIYGEPPRIAQSRTCLWGRRFRDCCNARKTLWSALRNLGLNWRWEKLDDFKAY